MIATRTRTRTLIRPKSRGRPLGLALGVLTALLCAIALLAPPPAQAQPSARTCTWNMQGASHATENKWNTGVQPLMANCDVLALQEAGAMPASATFQQSWKLQGGTVHNYTWGGTSSRPAYWVYWMQNDVNGNRVNLAIVVRAGFHVDDVASFTIPGQARPVLGVLIGGTWYFTTHADAYAANPAQNILTTVNHMVEVVYQAEFDSAYDWVVLGDFNTQPGAAQFQSITPWVLPPSGPTHNANAGNPYSTYDFAATNATHDPQLTGQVDQGIQLSDHYPVYYNFAVCNFCGAP